MQPEIVDKEFVAGWGTLMLINAGLAQGKGRSGWNWFVLSLILGPVATALIVILGRVAPRPAVLPDGPA